MTKAEAMKLIDDHKNALDQPGRDAQLDMLRVIILQIPDE
jgi:hypothetical protein